MERTPGATRALGHCSNEKMLRLQTKFYFEFCSPNGNSWACPQCQAGVVHQFWNCVVDLEGNQFNPINLSIQNIAVVQFNQGERRRHLISVRNQRKMYSHRLNDNLEICSDTRLVFLRPVNACSSSIWVFLSIDYAKENLQFEQQVASCPSLCRFHRAGTEKSFTWEFHLARTVKIRLDEIG